MKIRGFRIELGEIESVITEHPAVAATATAIREDMPGDRRLVAYVVPERGRLPTADELRAHVQERLPAFMVPSAFVTVDAFPLTANGKLDRASLPAPAVEERSAEEVVAPAAGTEARLAAIWQDVLALDAVGAADHFFNLGGHSLLAAKVVTRVRDEFEIELSVRALFEHPVLAAFATEVDASRPAGAAAPIVAAPSQSVTAARRIRSRSSSSSCCSSTTSPRGTRRTTRRSRSGSQGRSTVAALEQAINVIVRRHEALRTVLHIGRRVGRTGRAPRRGGSSCPSSTSHAKGPIWTTSCASTHGGRSTSARDLMLRATLFRLAAVDHIVLFQTHHVAFDALGGRDLLPRARGRVRRVSRGRRAPQLPVLPLQYRDFARVAAAGPDRRQARARDRASGAGTSPARPPFLPLPADRARPDTDTFEAGRLTIELPREVADDVAASVQPRA